MDSLNNISDEYGEYFCEFTLCMFTASFISVSTIYTVIRQTKERKITSLGCR